MQRAPRTVVTLCSYDLQLIGLVSRAASPCVVFFDELDALAPVTKNRDPANPLRYHHFMTDVIVSGAQY